MDQIHLKINAKERGFTDLNEGNYFYDWFFLRSRFHYEISLTPLIGILAFDRNGNIFIEYIITQLS